MKKGIVIGAVVAVVVIVGGILFIATRTSEQKSGGSSEQVGSYKQLDACKLFTEADAKALMGGEAASGNNTPGITSDDIAITNCSYTNNAKDVKQIKIITVSSRAPLTKVGYESNKSAFTERKSGTEKVTGYGEDAYWDPAMHQLAILKDDNWISIVYGGTNPANNTLQDAKLVADKILEKN